VGCSSSARSRWRSGPPSAAASSRAVRGPAGAGHVS
jgi:hypothetical protein